MTDQDDVIRFLSDGASYGVPGAPVERIETHISCVFLVGDRVYKLKRAIKLPYLDYSTPQLRKACCEAELALNRRTAPAIYRRVRSIGRRPDGALAFDEGVPVDWVLEMRRFDETQTFDRLAAAGTLTPAMLRDVTDAIARFHGEAEVRADRGGTASLAQLIADNDKSLVAAAPPLDAARVAELRAASSAALAALGDLLDRRRVSGKVRRCHGDLHLRNICLVEGRPTLFDCIEFSDVLACIDVLYDLAFLLMDLIACGRRDLAAFVFNRYLDLSDELDGLAALPLFLSVRAAVRAHVAATRHAQGGAAEALAEARRYLDLAGALLAPGEPRLIAIGGLSGVGKSSIAQALAPDFLPAPAARVIRSDVIRKRLFGVAPETRLPPEAYDTATTARVYAALDTEARAALTAGYAAIVDATFIREKERAAIARTAERAGVPFVGLWLQAPEAVLAARIAARRGDASDADRAVLARQLRLDLGAMDWSRIDASGESAATLAATRRALGLASPLPE